MRIPSSFLKGIITITNRLTCNECRKIFEQGDTVFTDGSQKDYEICEECMEITNNEY